MHVCRSEMEKKSFKYFLLALQTPVSPVVGFASAYPHELPWQVLHLVPAQLLGAASFSSPLACPAHPQ